MKFSKIIAVVFFLHICNLSAFKFTFDPIDVVIPCHKKDLITLNLVIDGARRNVKNVRRIIVVSETRLTDQAEWFDESQFPFTKKAIAYEIFSGQPQRAEQFIKQKSDNKTQGVGWIFQQFLKLYSIFVIPDISDNVLIIDADTIFMQPITFQDPVTGAGLYNPGHEMHEPYFAHLKRVWPAFRKVFKYSGISHHMLFQRSVMEQLFIELKAANANEEPWRVFCHKIDLNWLGRSCMCVEYELYFNFVFAKSNDVKIRKLTWKNIPFRFFKKFKNSKYHYLSCHAYLN